MRCPRCDALEGAECRAATPAASTVSVAVAVGYGDWVIRPLVRVRSTRSVQTTSGQRESMGFQR